MMPDVALIIKLHNRFMSTQHCYSRRPFGMIRTQVRVCSSIRILTRLRERFVKRLEGICSMRDDRREV